MQSVRSRIWTRVAVSISCDDNHYTTGTSSKKKATWYSAYYIRNNVVDYIIRYEHSERLLPIEALAIWNLNSFSKNHNINNKLYKYIVIHRQTVSLYHNSQVWQDPQDAQSWYRNPLTFTLDMASNRSANFRRQMSD